MYVCLFVCLFVRAPTPYYLVLMGETWHDCTLRPGEGFYLGGTFGDPL